MESELAKARRESKKADRKREAQKRKDERTKAKEKREKDKADLAAARKKVAEARAELRIKKGELRGGMKEARKTYREGNKDCRTTRRNADAPYRTSLKQNKVDFEACKSAVQGRTWSVIGERVLPLQPEVERLSMLVPPPQRSASAARNQELWGERLDQARAEIMRSHPELAANMEQLLGPVGRFGSRAARELRERTDQLVGGRPVMSIAELIAQRAADEGWNPGAGLAGGAPELQRAADSAAARSVKTMMQAGPPSDVRALLERFSPSSAVPPSLVTPSALTFPPTSGRTRLDTLIDPLFNPAAPAPQGIADEIITASRRGTPPSRPARRARGAGAARGQGPRTRAPRTQQSPGSKPPPKKPRKPRAKKEG